MTTSHSSLDDGQIVKTADSLSHSLPVIKTTDQGAPTDPTAIQTTTTTTTMQEQLLDQTQTEQIREQQNVVQPQQQRTMGSSKKSWIEKRDRMFAKSGYVSLEQMPEELPESALKENTRVLTGRKIGKMEMIKARKEYRKKREVAIRRQRTMDAYYDTINQEEMEIRATKEMNALRDEWDAIHVLDTKEERQQFMEDAVSGDRQRILNSLMKVFVKLNEVDLNIFTYHNEEEMYQNYEQKMRYINAGHVLRSMVAKYISLGGAFENATYQKLQALSSFYEGLEYAYSSNKLTRQNPQYLLMRDSDYKKLTTKRIAQSEEDVKKAKDKHKAANGAGSDPEKRLENVESFLAYVLQERGMLGDSEIATKELRVKLEIKEKALEKLIKDNKKKNGKNAPDTNDIKITRRGVEGLRLRIQRRESGEEAEPGSAYMQPGETAPAYYERMADIRRNMSAKAWTANLTAVKDILSAEVKYANKLYPKGTLHETKNGPWVRAGAGHRMTTRMSMVELTYMKRTGKSYEELIRLHEKAQKDGYPEDFIAVRDEIEGIIAGQKKLTGQGEEGESGDHSTADPQDVQKLAGIMEEMIRGFLLPSDIIRLRYIGRFTRHDQCSCVAVKLPIYLRRSMCTW
ncbi:MAG: hypothetical protein IKN24_10530 [Lachnospiraceae bacterium]|nr:hypothetical protein [Lachnospiraceae bacterium]